MKRVIIASATLVADAVMILGVAPGLLDSGDAVRMLLGLFLVTMCVGATLGLTVFLFDFKAF